MGWFSPSLTRRGRSLRQEGQAQLNEYYDEEEEDAYDQEGDYSDDERDTPTPPILSIDLWALVQEQEQYHRDDTTKTQPPPPDADSTTTLTEEAIDLTEESVENYEQDDSLLKHVDLQEPRLVRSKSWYQNCAGPRPAHLHRSRSVSMSPSSTFHECACTESLQVPPCTRCIQSLLPDPVRPSVLGPAPGASLELVSNRSAVAILCTVSQEPQIVPLVVECGDSLETTWEIVTKMQSELQERLCIQPDGSFKTYLQQCENLASRKGEWIALLEDCLPNEKHDSTHSFQHLVTACERRGLSMGETNDLFDLFRLVENTSTTQHNKGPPDDECHKENACLICFDDISENDRVQLIPCGHQLCSDCLTAYLASASRSADAKIQCPAFQCPTRLNVLDIAHALFLHSPCKQDSARVIFDKLFRFEMEKSGTQLCFERGNKTRHCPSPSCNRVLVNTGKGSNNIPGSNMFLCTCGGITLCAGDCKDGGPSHPGIPCAQFQKLYKSIESGKLDAEFANVQWMLKHTQPCPKCRYPIERDGGCNHVRCIACQYYFCWHCGGPGNECMAFLCENKGRYWHQEADYDEDKYGNLYSRITRFWGYRNAQRKLGGLVKSLAKKSVDNDDEIRHLTLLDIQLCQVALWIHAFNLAKDGATKPQASSTVIALALQHVEMMSHVLSLRKLMVQNRASSNKTSAGTFSTDDVAAAMGLNNTAKQKSKCKQQAKMRREARKRPIKAEENGIPSLIVDHDLEALCKLDDAQLEKKVVDVIRRALTHLLPSCNKVDTQVPKRHGRKTKRRNLRNARLNVKLERRHDPWRMGMRRVQEDSDESSENNRQPVEE